MSADGSPADEEASPDGDRLVMRIVEYPNTADRCTIYPPALGDHERLTHWLSADREAFVALDRHR